MAAKRMALALSLILLILLIGFVILREGKKEEGGISFKEKQQIEAWILENNLNPYGDPKDTVYIGGTPLFDEETGKSIDKYEYILENYPDRSWLK